MRLHEVQHCVQREQSNGESLVEEGSVDEYVVEQRKRRCWARAKYVVERRKRRCWACAKHRFGRHQNIDKQDLPKLLVAQTIRHMNVRADSDQPVSYPQALK